MNATDHKTRIEQTPMSRSVFYTSWVARHLSNISSSSSTPYRTANLAPPTRCDVLESHCGLLRNLLLLGHSSAHESDSAGEQTRVGSSSSSSKTKGKDEKEDAEEFFKTHGICRLLVMHPGNPGVPHFYDQFVAKLIERENHTNTTNHMAVLVLGFAGHNIIPHKSNSKQSNHDYIEENDVFLLQDQIEVAFEFYCTVVFRHFYSYPQRVDEHGRESRSIFQRLQVFSAGHSIGAFIALHMTARFPSAVSSYASVNALMSKASTDNTALPKRCHIVKNRPAECLVDENASPLSSASSDDAVVVDNHDVKHGFRKSFDDCSDLHQDHGQSRQPQIITKLQVLRQHEMKISASPIISRVFLLTPTIMGMATCPNGALLRPVFASSLLVWIISRVVAGGVLRYLTPQTLLDWVLRRRQDPPLNQRHRQIASELAVSRRNIANILQLANSELEQVNALDIALLRRAHCCSWDARLSYIDNSSFVRSNSDVKKSDDGFNVIRNEAETPKTDNINSLSSRIRAYYIKKDGWVPLDQKAAVEHHLNLTQDRSTRNCGHEHINATNKSYAESPSSPICHYDPRSGDVVTYLDPDVSVLHAWCCTHADRVAAFVSEHLPSEHCSRSKM